jgi:RNA polymerase sigma-70 factor, ECF subfamily
MLVNQLGKLAVTIPLQSVAPEKDDAMQVAAAKNGHNQAFEALVRRHRPKLLRVVMRFTRNREDAEDIVQQTFQKAFIHLQQFEGISSFSTWVTRIAMNEALMWLRRRRASREVSTEESGTDNQTLLPVDFADPGPSPEDGFLGQERQRILSRAINELTPEQRAAIELRELKELSTQETAARMGISVGAVKARVFQGRRKLRAILKLYFERTQTHRNKPARPIDEANGVSRQPLICGACD